MFGISIPRLCFPGCDEILAENDDMALAISSDKPIILLAFIPALDAGVPSIGEIIGPLTQKISLGTEEYKYYLDRSFKSFPEELLYRERDPPEKSISGVVKASPKLSNLVSTEDRLVIMLFDPEKGRPIAVKIMDNFALPQKFSIGHSNALGIQTFDGRFSLRILTDKNNQPLEPVIGEIIGRSKKLIALGTKNIDFVMDQNYVR